MLFTYSIYFEYLKSFASHCLHILRADKTFEMPYSYSKVLFNSSSFLT